ncbi:MAG: hypothetical protein GX175_00990 [Halanaerobiaceae bacterium]|nr:hypothetical protein [Halanaerobiaceae bacterium]
MQSPERIAYALRETEILREPEELISTTRSTTLAFYVLAEPAYLEVFKHEGQETKIRKGKISWEKPRLTTPFYILDMEGFSSEAKEALRILAMQYSDLAGILYKMRYRKEDLEERTVPYKIMETFRRLENKIEDQNERFSVVIKGIDELWDVSLMKYIQKLIIRSVIESQIPYYENKGYLRMDERGFAAITRNLEGLPIVAQNEIEEMFEEVKKGNLDPSVLKRELDSWGVFSSYEDRFFDLFRKK